VKGENETMRNLLKTTALLAALVMAGGCISNTKYGVVADKVIGDQAKEGDVIALHGAPDNIVYLGTQYFNPTSGVRGSIDKYIYEYRIGGGTTILGHIYATDSFQNICYLIEGGVVKGGASIVPEGSGTIILNGSFLHPKVRAGYGGDGTPSGLPLNLPKPPGLLGLGIGPF